MRESCTSGSVRGARGNSRPYRNVVFAVVHEFGPGTSCQSSILGLRPLSQNPGPRRPAPREGWARGRIHQLVRM